MRRVYYLLLLIIFIISCKNEARNIVKFESSEGKISNSNGELNSIIIEKNIYKNIVSPKLQELYDLLVLQHEHPIFKNDIKNQLRSLTNDSIDFSLKEHVIIRNVVQRGNIVEISDSVDRVKLYFNKVLKNSVVTDSIFVFITSKSIKLENEEIKAYKVKFSKIN